MKITRGDLAALRHRGRDAIDKACAKLEGQVIAEGETIRITLTASAVPNASGCLVFGEMEGFAQHV